MRQRLTERQNPPSSGLRLLAHAEASRGGTRRHALRSIDCAARAYKAGQKLAPRAANVSVSVTTRKIGGGLGSPFGPAGPAASGASGSLRSRRARSPLGPADPCALPRLASFAVRWRQVGRRTGSAALADQALWTDRVLADPLDPADQPERRALEGQLRPAARKDLAPWCTTATRHGDKGGALGSHCPMCGSALPSAEAYCGVDHARRVPRTARVVQPR